MSPGMSLLSLHGAGYIFRLKTVGMYLAGIRKYRAASGFGLTLRERAANVAL
jgi:hypothetical protein